MRVMLIGEGPTDHAVVASLVRNLLARDIQFTHQQWKTIRGHQTRGLDRKLGFAVRQSLDADFAGVVAVTDQDDKSHERRLSKLQDQRTADRAGGRSIPTVLGEARPEIEAWILCDKLAIREILSDVEEADVPVPTRCRRPRQAKDAVTALLDRHPSADSGSATLGRIAACIVPGRCQSRHVETTGLAEFDRDVQRELAESSSSDRPASG